MQPGLVVVVSAAKVAKFEGVLNYSKCIICQTDTIEDLVGKPVAHEKVVEFIKLRALEGDGIYPETWRRLQNMTLQDLSSNSATWHRKCYQETVHTGSIRNNYIYYS